MIFNRVDVIITGLLTMSCFEPGPLDPSGLKILDGVYNVWVVTTSNDRGAAGQDHCGLVDL